MLTSLTVTFLTLKSPIISLKVSLKVIHISGTKGKLGGKHNGMRMGVTLVK